MQSHSDGVHAAEPDGLGHGTAQGEAERQGQLGGQRGRWWQSALERTSMQLRDNLMSVPEGVLPMGDATGQVNFDTLCLDHALIDAHALQIS